MGDVVGIGDFIPWDGGCLLIGRAVAVNPSHAHYAIQVAFGSEPGVRFRTDAREAWSDYDVALIPSRQPHMMDATRVALDAVLFVEPETPQGRALTERYPGGGIVALPREALAGSAAALFGTWQAHGHGNATIAWAPRRRTPRCLPPRESWSARRKSIRSRR